MQKPKIQQSNKATAAIVAGAVMTIASAFAPVDPEVLAASQTALTALLVWLIPNK